MVSESDAKRTRASEEAGSESFLRSDLLVLCELVLPAEVAFECLVALGNAPDPVHIGCEGAATGPATGTARSVSAVSLPTKQCRDLLMTLGSIRTHLAAYQEYIRLHCAGRQEQQSPDDGSADTWSAGLKPKMLYDLEASICSLHKDLTELSKYETEMNSQYVRMVHLVNILDCLDNVFWAENVPRASSAGVEAGAILLAGSSETVGSESDNAERTLPFVAGVVPSSKAHGLRLGVWRKFHLTALYTDVMVQDQLDLRDRPVESQNLFLIICVSEQQRQTADRLCRMLGAETYEIPATNALRKQLASETRDRLSEMRQVFLEGEEHRKRLALSGWFKWRRWFAQLSVMQAVYQALGQCSLGYTKQYYVGEIWCSQDSIDSVREALNAGSRKASGVRATVRLVEGHNRRPPTRMPRHEVTVGVRDLIYQFGVPAYREIDPTPFTAVTFPFLFAVMFGDWGHGLLLLVFALALFLPAGRLLHPGVAEALSPLRPMRHLLLLCALFAVYCGAVLNEGFGLTVGWRRWSQFSLGNLTYDTVVNRSMSGLQLTPKDAGYRMSWATDCMWGGAANQVKFFNSARMKMSIIFGFLHLALGLVLQLANDAFAGRTANLVLFSLAKLVFHFLLMGYPVCLIVYKWVAVRPADAACAPALLPMLISMYRFSYTDTPCYLAPFYPGQKYIEHAIVACVAASALVAAFGLPIRHALSGRCDGDSESGDAANAVQQRTPRRLASMAAPPDGPSSEEEFASLSDKSDLSTSSKRRDYRDSKRRPTVTVQQNDGVKHFDLLEHFLHCFEFLLSSLSHSASYLRLWAIGLAHGELTTIMWPMLLLPPTRLSDLANAWSPVASHMIGGLTLAASFCLWACITVCILVGMEGMTALLHSLRLHWIEFQSKFYAGDGYLFRPFCLRRVAAEASESCKHFSAVEESI